MKFRIRLLSMVAALSLAGCGTVELFGKYDLPEGPEVEASPYPRLIDTPDAPSAGEYTSATPDPAEGVAIQVDLAAAGQAAAVEAKRLEDPVIPPEERDALDAAAEDAEAVRGIPVE